MTGLQNLPQAYYDWFRKQSFSNPIPTAELKTLVAEDLSRFKAMTTEEYILYQKWEEIRDAYPMEESILLGEPAYTNKNDARLLTQVKSMLWKGNYEDIEPELLWIGDPANETIKDHWTALRICIHSQQHSGSIGRGINYLVRDRSTRKYLGVIAIASDFLDLGPRDQEIGWTREQRTQGRMIQHTAVCSTVVPVQPFGFNYVGGKLLALLCLSDQVQVDWFNQYGNVLVGLTTTSLYGKGKGISQYDNLKYWKRMGYSQGSTAYKLSLQVRAKCMEWAKVVMPQDYWKFMVAKEDDWTVRDKNNRFYQAIYRKLGLSSKLYTSNHDRGIYFARLFKDTDAFLRAEPGKMLEQPVGNMTIEALTKLWKDKYASQRVRSLAANNRIKSNTALFYDDLAVLSWEDAKTKYLQDVGR